MILRTWNSLKTLFRKQPNVFREYGRNAFGKYLFATNVASSGLTMFFGDLLQQNLEKRLEKKEKNEYDYVRSTRMLVVGLLMGPMHHYYYVYLNKIMPERTISTVTKKILLDQFFMGPLSILFFFTGIGLLEMKSTREIRGEIDDKFMKVYIMDWIVWPPSQFVNFYFLPAKYQVLYINFITLIYDTFLSYVKHKEEAAILDS